MDIISLNDDKKINNTIVILGNFDGIHRGHQSLIDKANELKATSESALKVVFFTFYPYPLEIITGKKVENLIISRDEKIYLAESLGLDIYFECDFDKDTLRLSPDEFIDNILIDKLGVKHIVVGDDFRFGYKRSGDVDYLSKRADKCGYKVHKMDRIRSKGDIISSTLLRKCIEDLDFKRFRELAGRDYFILGEVLHGKAIGRTLGYPTCNQRIDDSKLPLKKGVYASRTQVAGKLYDSISFVGNSLGNKARGQFETFIFDFDEMIYGEQIRVDIVAFVREQIKMNSLDELKETIENDIKVVKGEL